MCNCPFCEYSNGYFEIRGQNFKNKILFESENFLVFPSLGQIVEGYLLISSKEHYIGIGEVPMQLHQELENVQEKVRNILTENYGTPLFFEHGPVSRSKRGGCCIEHAHIHAVPVQMDILNDIADKFQFKKITNYDGLTKQFSKGIPYLFLEENSDRYVFEIPDIIPSQYIRKIIAHKIEKPDRWDWHSCLGLEEMSRTIKKLSGKFE